MKHELRCYICKKYAHALLTNGRCEKCESEYKMIAEKIIKRYSGALKKLAER